MQLSIRQGKKMNHPYLFTSLNVGKYQIRNRLVALPVHTGFAHTDGSVSSWMIDFYSRLAKSGVGMVVVANAAVSHDGVVSKFNLRADKDQFIPGLSKLAETIKQKGAIACIQLNHAGRFAKTERPLMPSPITSSHLTFNIESLKGFMEFFPFEKRFGLTRYLVNKIATWRDPMTADDRERVIEDFANAAVRSYQAGFDMVEIHGANGYLLCQYLSSFTNHIKSGVGGDFYGRAAFPLAVIRNIKQKLPKGFPVGFRLLLREWVPGGIDLPEAIAFAALLENEDIAYLSASAGTYNSILSPDILKTMSRPAYLDLDMAELTKSVHIPTIISGRVTTPSCADKLIKEGVADLIGLGRPIRSDLKWVEKARNPERSGRIIKCINCNSCLKRVVLEQGFNCTLWPKLYRERTQLEHKFLTRNSSSLWIVTSQEDMQIFKKSLPLLILKQYSYSDTIHNNCPITVLFIQRVVNDHRFVLAIHSFIEWIESRFDYSGTTNISLKSLVRDSGDSLEQTVCDEIKNGDYGRVFICSNSEEPWRGRLLYKESGKVLLYLSSNNRQHKVIIPVDLSDTTLLVMSFLQQNYMKKQDFSFNFIHVVTGCLNQEKLRWRELEKIAGFSENIPLELIFTQRDVTSTLIETIQTRGYGTVVMGKRGLSGIKRWLLGSVSAGVLRKLTDQALLLID